MRVLAIDPGGTTGWSFWDPPSERPIGGENDDSFRIRHLIEKTMHTLGPGAGILVCEDFRITGNTAKKSPQTTALRILGTAEYLAWREGWEFVLQQPSQAKQFATNEKLKRLAWYHPGKEHQNDATRHVLLFAVERGLLDGRELVS